MEVIKIYIKENKKGERDFITAKRNETGAMAMFTYYKEDQEKACSFNKYSFIEKIKALKVPKKYIKQVEEI